MGTSSLSFKRSIKLFLKVRQFYGRPFKAVKYCMDRADLSHLHCYKWTEELDFSYRRTNSGC